MDWKQIAILAALVVALLLVRQFGKQKGAGSRSARLMKKYATLTPAQLLAAPEEEMVEAVVSHVLAQAAESRRPDPVYVLSGKPQGFTVVYSVWAVCKEMAQGDYAALLHTATKELTESAGAGFTAIGAVDTAAAWQAVQDAHEAKTDTAEAEHAFHLAVERECPLAMCVSYIRDNPEQFGAAEESDA